MKKLVMFTLVMVVGLSGTAFAVLNDNNVAVATDDGQAVAVDGKKPRRCASALSPRPLVAKTNTPMWTWTKMLGLPTPTLR